MSDVKVGDRVKIVGWPVQNDEEIVGQDGTVVRTRGMFVIVKMDNRPDWLVDEGLCCKPSELEKL